MSTLENRSRAATQTGALWRIASTRLQVRALEDGGIEIVERLPCDVGPTAHSLAYLRTKKREMGHTVSLDAHRPERPAQGIEAQL